MFEADANFGPSFKTSFLSFLPLVSLLLPISLSSSLGILLFAFAAVFSCNEEAVQIATCIVVLGEGLGSCWRLVAGSC